MSCPDAIARTLRRFGALDISEVVGLILEGNGGTAGVEPASSGASDEDALVANVPPEVVDAMSKLEAEREAAGIR